MNRKKFLQNSFKGAAVGRIIPHFPELLSADAAQEKPAGQLSRSDLIVAAREIIASQQYCALITQDEQGRSQARTVNPFAPTTT